MHRMEEEPLQEDKGIEGGMQLETQNALSEDACEDGETCASTQEEFTCSLYISRAAGPQSQVQETQGGESPISLSSITQSRKLPR